MKSPLTWGTDSGYVSVGVGMKCWGTKHVMEMTKWTLHGSTCKSFNYLFFFFLHNCWVVGKFCGLSGSGAGLRVGLVRLFYIIRLWASLLICRQAREWPLTTCYVKLLWVGFFSGANQVRWWRLEYLMSFLPCGMIALCFLWGTNKNNVLNCGWIAKSVTEKNQRRVDVRKSE